MKNGVQCGTVGLFVYRDGNWANPNILILRYGNVWEPFTSGGEPLTESSLVTDRYEVSVLHARVSRLNFYSGLGASDRSRLNDDMPKC